MCQKDNDNHQGLSPCHNHLLTSVPAPPLTQPKDSGRNKDFIIKNSEPRALDGFSLPRQSSVPDFSVHNFLGKLRTSGREVRGGGGVGTRGGVGGRTPRPCRLHRSSLHLKGQPKPKSTASKFPTTAHFDSSPGGSVTPDRTWNHFTAPRAGAGCPVVGVTALQTKFTSYCLTKMSVFMEESTCNRVERLRQREPIRHFILQRYFKNPRTMNVLHCF